MVSSLYINVIIDRYELVSRKRRSDFDNCDQVMVIDETPIDEQIQNVLIKLHGPDSKWRSKEQKESVYAIVRGDRYVVSILPTGAGKTDLILISALVDTSKTYIVVTPNVALAGDLRQRCEGLKIDCIQWTNGSRRRANIVVAVTDIIISATFNQYLRDLEQDGRLGPLFFDEAHTLTKDANWRHKFMSIKLLSFAVQFIFMTATHPPVMKRSFDEALLLKNPEPTYIRAIIYRREIAYSVETVDEPGESAESRAIEFITSQKVEPRQKILVFSRYIKTIKRLRDALGCAIYHANEPTKAAQLKAWQDGDVEVMAASSALGAGMNVDKVVLVVHVGVTWGCMTFSQESGRAGRGGENVRSVTFIDKAEMRELEKLDSRHQTADDAALSEFLTAKGCRQQPLNVYYNGEDAEAVTCETLNGNRCDRCSVRGQMSAEQKRRNEEELRKEEKRRRSQDYERRKIDVEEEIMTQSLHEIDVTKIIEKLQYGCPACWLGCKDEIYHEVESCANWEFTGMEHDGFKSGVKYAKDCACMNCSLPCDWCSEYVEGGAGRCRRKDVIMPVVMRCRLMHHGQEVIRRLAEKEFEREKNYIEWLGKTRHVFGRKSTNAFWLFSEMCRICL
jgi:superfamily II DNA helicase RecQ